MSENTTSTEALVMERTFEAPIDLIWQLWTEPEHFKNWYGPQGFSVPVAEMDLRVGGKRLICMEGETPNGTMQFWTVGEYTEIVPNQRLVYTESMADENGNILPSPDTSQPSTTVVTVLLEDLGESTKMTMTHAGLSENAQGANMGWEQAFAKLADYVKAVK